MHRSVPRWNAAAGCREGGGEKDGGARKEERAQEGAGEGGPLPTLIQFATVMGAEFSVARDFEARNFGARDFGARDFGAHPSLTLVGVFKRTGERVCRGNMARERGCVAATWRGREADLGMPEG